MKRRWGVWFLAGIFLFGLTHTVFSAETTIWGPTQLLINKGKKKNLSDTFDKTFEGGAFKVLVVNGDGQGSNRVSTGTVTLNGNEIISNIDDQTDTLEVAVGYLRAAGNDITINISGAKQSYVTVTVKGTPEPAGDFTAQPGVIAGGESSTLNWSFSDADTVSIDNGIGSVAAVGSTVVTPAQTTTYNLTASGPGGGLSRRLIVFVDETEIMAPGVLIFASRRTLQPGESTTLNWVTYLADSASIDNGIGSVPVNGSIDVSPSVTTTYNISVSGPGGGAAGSITILVNTNPSAPTVSISASPPYVDDASILTWASTDADTVSIDQGIGSVALNGTYVATPSISTVYTVTASGSGGTAEAGAAVINEKFAYVSLSAADTTLLPGETTTLNWSTGGADAVFMNNGIGIIAADGSMEITPSGTTTYTITAATYGGTAAKSVTVYVEDYPVPTINLSASPVSIPAGGSADLTWSSAYADTVDIDNGVGSVALNGTQSVSPATAVTYTATATGPGGTSVASATVTVVFPVPTVSLQAAPTDILSGDPVTLSWTSTDATSAAIDNGIGDVAVSGSMQVSPTVTTTYTITVTGPGGTAQAGASVTVTIPPPTVNMSASPSSIYAGETALLSWSSTDGVSAVIDNGIGSVSVNGGVSVSPVVTTTYTITVTGPGGTAQDSATVTIIPGSPPPTVVITAVPTFIDIGQNSTLSWTSTNADSASIDNGIGSVAVNGSTSVSPVMTATYTIDVSGPGGTASDSVTVDVNAQYCSLEGTVTNGATGVPIEGVNVDAQDGYQTLTAVTDINGRYAIPNLVAGSVTAVFTKSGYTTYQETITIPADVIYDLTTYMSEILTGAVLTGYVTDSVTGNPIEGADVTAVYNGTSLSALTLTDGSYLLEDLPVDEPVEITASCAGYLPETSNQTFPAAASFQLDFQLFDASAVVTVSGTVIDAKTFNTVDGVAVTHQGTGNSAVSDGSGFYQITGIPMGDQYFTIEKDGFVDRTMIFTVNSDPFQYDIIEPLDFNSADPLEVDYNLTGVVTDSITQRPIPNAVVRCPTNDLYTTADAQGVYTFSGLPEGTYPLVAMGLDHKAYLRMVTVSSGGAGTLDYQLFPTTIGVVKGTITDAGSGEPIHIASVKVDGCYLLAAASEADGTYTLTGAPTGTYSLTVTHPDYEPQTSAAVTVNDLTATTLDFALTRRPEVGNLDGTVTDATSGSPVAGAVLTVDGTSVTAVTNTGGYYKLNDAPSGLVDITVTAAGYPVITKTAGVAAHLDSATPTDGLFDFTLDAGESTAADSVTGVFTAADDGFLTSPGSGFSLAVPAGMLSADAEITITTASTIDGLTIQPGEVLSVDPDVGDGTETVRAVSRLFKVSLASSPQGNPTPTVDGLMMILGCYLQTNIDDYNVDEETILPFYHDGSQWTAMQMKPAEMRVDVINNLSVVVVNPNLTDTGVSIDAGGSYIFVLGGVEKAVSSAAVSSESSGIPTNVKLYDYTDMNVVTAKLGSDFYPDVNAVPMIYFHGWEPTSLFKNYKGLDPNTDERVLQVMTDFIEFTNGVYRPVVMSYNTRAGIMEIGEMIGVILHGDYLNLPGQLIGMPAEGEPLSGTFPFIDAFGTSAGGIYSRCYQSLGGEIKNLIQMGTPNHGTLDIVFKMALTYDSITSPTMVFNPIRWLLYFLKIRSPGTNQLIAYDDRAELSESTNPVLQQLNNNTASVPDSDLTMIAGTESGFWGKALFGLSRPNDGFVPVDSVFNYTSESGDDAETSLFDFLLQANAYHNEKKSGRMFPVTKPFNHFDMGKAAQPIKDFEEVILRGLSDWVVAKVIEGNPNGPLLERDNYQLLPTVSEPGAARARIRVQYNVWDSVDEGNYSDVWAGRDIDKITVVLYYKDGYGDWHIADCETNGAYPDKLFRDVRTIWGNSQTYGPEEFIITATFPIVDPDDAETEVTEVQAVLVTLGPAAMDVPLPPEIHFGIPGTN